LGPRDELSGLLRSLDWAALLHEVGEQGAAFAAEAMTPGCRARLVAELATGPYQRLPPVIGPVRQEAEAFMIPLARLEGYPVLAGLCAELVAAVHQHGVPQWVPNEVAVQRYLPGSAGISPHRDRRRYAQLIAVITVTGSASFTLCRDRRGEPIRSWPARAGSLVLLRGLGLGGVADGRPMHAVAGPTATGTPRISVGLRMDTAVVSGP
jgi:hypothetical protein